jgi:PKD repeat protein
VAVVTATPTSVKVGQAVSFDGSASSDPDGSIATYVWDFGDGTGAHGATTTHAYATPGSFVARLTVTDDGGSTDSATVTIAVSRKGRHH